jgi:transposase
MGSTRKSQLSKTKQDRLIEYFVAGAIARRAADPVRVNPKHRFIIFHRLREIITYHRKNEADTIFSGEI